MQPIKQRILWDQNGATLIVLIVALIAISVIGAGIHTMTSRSTNDSVNLNFTQRAYYLAESGIRWMEAEYRNNPTAAENVYTNITKTGGSISMGQDNGGGRLTLEIHPFSGRYDAAQSSGNILVINFPGTLDSDVFNLNPNESLTGSGTLWHNDGLVDFTSVKRIVNADGTDALKINIDSTATLPGDTDRIAFTAQVKGGEIISNDGDLELDSGEGFFPLANGIVRTKALIPGVGKDFIKFHYKQRTGSTLKGISHYETRDGTKITQATLIKDEPLVLLPCFRYVATGTVGTASSTVNGFLYDGISSQDTATIEHKEDGTSLKNWTNSGSGSTGSFKIANDGSIKVSSLGSYASGTSEISEASMTLDWSNTDIDLEDAAESAGGFLSYEIQTKIKQGQANGTDDNSFFAGISFRVQDDGTQYGLSLFRPRELVKAETDTIELTGTVRDFRADPWRKYRPNGSWPLIGDWHPDFERKNSGLKSGFVKKQLGDDQKPVYNNTRNTNKYLAGEKYFNQWYRDVPGVNKSKDYTLTFTKNASTGQYTFDTTAFFPIDNELYGNYWYWKNGNRYEPTSKGVSHNYHFTFELHSKFTYEPGQTFTFRGDDDVWVFINNKLVIDLSGCHGPKWGTVNLDKLGLVEKKVYNFDFFCAERHTFGSNFRIQTEIELVNLTDGIPGSTDKTGGSTVWPHIPPDNGGYPQVVEASKKIQGDGWAAETEKWLERTCGRYPYGPGYFSGKAPVSGQMDDSDCTDDCFPICSYTKPTYYDVWNTGFDWGSQEESGEIEKTGAANTFLLLWERTVNDGGSYDYNWLAYRLLDPATDLPEAAVADGIISNPSTGRIQDWSTLGVRVKEVTYLWATITDKTAYEQIDRGDYISAGVDQKAGGYCFDKPLDITGENKGMILLTQVNRDSDDKIIPFANGSKIYIQGQADPIGAIEKHQDQVNLIQAYVSRTDKNGIPGDTSLLALDKNRKGNPRTEVNWLPEDHQKLNASTDYHRVIQWMAWNADDYHDYGILNNYTSSEVSADTPWTRNNYTMDRIFTRLTSILTHSSFSAASNPEVGLHAFGSVNEEDDEDTVVNSGIDMYFDDFAIRTETTIPDLGATIGTAQSR